MGDGLRTIRVVTTDESLLSNVRAAASAIEGWETVHAASVDELLETAPALGDVVLLDGWLRSGNVYENCRRLTGDLWDDAGDSVIEHCRWRSDGTLKVF